jgi:hypothetical protein
MKCVNYNLEIINLSLYRQPHRPLDRAMAGESGSTANAVILSPSLWIPLLKFFFIGTAISFAG